MRILAIERELKPLPAETAAEILREEAARVWELQRQEVIREIWFTRRGTLAVVLLECASEEDAQRALGTLPLVRDGFIAFEVNALRPYDGFARLFATGQAGGG
jgi:muconolactone delta-isomerase